MSTLHVQSKPESARIAGQLQLANRIGILTDAMIAANATITLLKAAVLAAAGHQQKTIAQRTNIALDRAKSLGLITETHGLTTVAGFTALMDAPSTSFYQPFHD